MVQDLPAEKVLKLVEAKRDSMVSTLQQLIRTPSTNPGFGKGGSEKEIVDILQDKLRGIGVSDIEVLEKTKSRPNLIATLRGSRGRPVLMLSAHTDTVIVDREHLWTVDPFSGLIKDGEVYGLGSCDMKGAIASILAATEALIDAKVRLNGDLQLVFAADEEWGSHLGTRWLIAEKGLRPDAAIVTEPSSIRKKLDYVHVAVRGAVDFTIRVYGEQLHSGLADIEKPINASEKMAKVILRMKKNMKLRYRAPKYGLKPHTNIGVTVKGGQHQWSVPGECAFGVDIRIIPGMTVEGVVEDVQKFLRNLQREDPQLRAEFEMFPTGSTMGAEISPDEPIVRHVLEAARKSLGFKPKLGCFPGGDDAIFMINEAKIPTIASYGPGFLKYAHAPNEKVSIDEVVNAAKVYALTAMNYLGVSL